MATGQSVHKVRVSTTSELSYVVPQILHDAAQRDVEYIHALLTCRGSDHPSDLHTEQDDAVFSCSDYARQNSHWSECAGRDSHLRTFLNLPHSDKSLAGGLVHVVEDRLCWHPDFDFGFFL